MRARGGGVTFFVTTHYMDEAERCSHLGYIYYSKLIVYGTPAELKRLPDVTPSGAVRLEVRVPAVAQAMRMLNQHDFVLDATIFADVLHVLAAEGSEGRLVDALDAAGFTGAQIKEIPATLEDVFVTLTRERERERERELEAARD